MVLVCELIVIHVHVCVRVCMYVYKVDTQVYVLRSWRSMAEHREQNGFDCIEKNSVQEKISDVFLICVW